MTDDNRQITTEKDATPKPLDSAQPAPTMVPALRPAASLAETPAKKHPWMWIFGGFVALGIGALLYLQPWVVHPPVVAVEIASLAPATRVLAVNGRIAAVNSVGVRPLGNGAIEDLPIAEGDQIEANQVLVVIESDAQKAVIRQAEAGLDTAILAQDDANETYRRSLALGDNVAVSALDRDARAVRSAAQEVARMTAQLDQARIVLARNTIRAPISGSVLTLNVVQGQIVDPSSLLLTLADLSELVVETDVDEAYATQIAQDQPAVLQLAGETATRTGLVRFVSARVDAATGGLAIKLGFDEPVSAPIGLTVTANIVIEQRAAALTVPRTAIIALQNSEGVFLVKDGTARFQPLDMVEWPAARLIVSSGLAEGDVIIVNAEGIVDGQAVAVEQP